jgi:hypothetical protein
MFPELEFFACFGCHFSQPTSTEVEINPIDPTKTRNVINLCKPFVQRLWGQEDINNSTTKFDSCGIFNSDGNVVIPSKTQGYQTA